MRKPLVAGNWKMSGTLDSTRDLVTAIKSDAPLGAEIVVCAPFVYLAEVQSLLAGTPVAWGAQDLSEYESGAYTGEVSGMMLTDFACQYVIVGHSERRTIFGESDTLVAEKFAAAQKCGLTPILCVGELLEEREEGVTDEVVASQLDAVIGMVGIGAFSEAVVAYEPVWAIGTGKTATPEQAQEVHAMIRQKLAGQDAAIANNLRILYGGSVKGNNASELFGMADIDGGLIGGASLLADEFLTICRAAAS
ncbi:MAG: triose-phosphate isomerase [Gammaproteobacteria bacterium]|nr:MAG: triose-phosphate isomerase [Gammaproteobacteria bacterium]